MSPRVAKENSKAYGSRCSGKGWSLGGKDVSGSAGTFQLLLSDELSVELLITAIAAAGPLAGTPVARPDSLQFALPPGNLLSVRCHDFWPEAGLLCP